MLKKLLLTVLLILFIFFSFLDLKANNLVVYNIDLLGNKSNSKKLMQKAGVPTIPGSNGDVKSVSKS